jgi:hypothetical protein
VRNYLIYTSAGHAANVKQWSSGTDRNYDIWVTNYTSTGSLNKKYSDFYNEGKGSKFQNLKTVFTEHRDVLSHYEAIMVADDDIIIAPGALSALFQILTDNDIWILQPAFSRFGKVSHAITGRRLSSSLRYVNFVEVTCPIFRTDKLLDFLSVYRPDLSTCFGIDWWFLNHFGTDFCERYAVSDKHYCINPRDCFKPGRRREIDSLGNHAQRISMWQTIKSEIGIDSFIHREYRRIPKSRLEVIRSFPVFAVELVFFRAFAFLAHLKHAIHSSLHKAGAR